MCSSNKAFKFWLWRFSYRSSRTCGILEELLKHANAVAPLSSIPLSRFPVDARRRLDGADAANADADLDVAAAAAAECVGSADE